MPPFRSLTLKQTLQLEIIDIDTDLQRLAQFNPEAKSIVNKVRDCLGRASHILSGVDVQDFCNVFHTDSGTTNNRGIAA